MYKIPSSEMEKMYKLISSRAMHFDSDPPDHLLTSGEPVDPTCSPHSDESDELPTYPPADLNVAPVGAARSYACHPNIFYARGVLAGSASPPPVTLSPSGSDSDLQLEAPSRRRKQRRSTRPVRETVAVVHAREQRTFMVLGYNVQPSIDFIRTEIHNRLKRNRNTCIWKGKFQVPGASYPFFSEVFKDWSPVDPAYLNPKQVAANKTYARAHTGHGTHVDTRHLLMSADGRMRDFCRFEEIDCKSGDGATVLRDSSRKFVFELEVTFKANYRLKSICSREAVFIVLTTGLYKPKCTGIRCTLPDSVHEEGNVARYAPGLVVAEEALVLAYPPVSRSPSVSDDDSEVVSLN